MTSLPLVHTEVITLATAPVHMTSNPSASDENHRDLSRGSVGIWPISAEVMKSEAPDPAYRPTRPWPLACGEALIT